MASGRLGWPRAAGPRVPAAGGGRRWRRRRSGRVEVAWSGQEASPRHEGATGGIDLGWEKAEEGARW